MKKFNVQVTLHGDEVLTTVIEAESKVKVKGRIIPMHGSNMLTIGDLLVPSPNIKAIQIFDEVKEDKIDTELIRKFLDGKARGTGVTTKNLELAINNNGIFVGLHCKHLQEKYPEIKIIELKDLDKIKGIDKPVYFDPAIFYLVLK